MVTREPNAGGPAAPVAPLHIEPLPISLLDDPLDYIFADHFRQRCVAAALRRFGETGLASRSEADMTIAFLERDLVLHHQDEDEDLFPAVRRRAAASDNLGPILARLGDDHRQLLPMTETIVEALSTRLKEDPVRLRRPAREVMLAYSRSEHHHLAIENGIVLVIARKRLGSADLKQISHGMKVRRGAS